MRANTPDRDDEFRSALALAGECRKVLRHVVDAPCGGDAWSTTSEGILNRTIWLLTAKIHDTFEAIVLLCEHGWGVEADILVRVILETVLNARFLKQQPDSGLFLYVEESEKETRAWLRGRDAAFDAKIKWPTEVLGVPPRTDPIAWWQDGKRRGTRRYWRNITTGEKVRYAQFGEWDKLYTRLCSGVHASGPIAGYYFSVDPEPSLYFGPKQRYSLPSLLTACVLLITHLHLLEGMFRPGIASDLERCRAQVYALMDES